jgi:hypothetical protein
MASAAFTLLKAQYGGPTQMAQKVLAQLHAFKQRKSSAAASRAVAH